MLAALAGVSTEKCRVIYSYATDCKWLIQLMLSGADNGSDNIRETLKGQMRLDAQGNQIPQRRDLISVAAGPPTCACGRWRAIRLVRELVCCGCFSGGD